jgi:hypothetical protein
MRPNEEARPRWRQVASVAIGSMSLRMRVRVVRAFRRPAVRADAAPVNAKARRSCRPICRERYDQRSAARQHIGPWSTAASRAQGRCEPASRRDQHRRPRRPPQCARIDPGTWERIAPAAAPGAAALLQRLAGHRSYPLSPSRKAADLTDLISPQVTISCRGCILSTLSEIAFC